MEDYVSVLLGIGGRVCMTLFECNDGLGYESRGASQDPTDGTAPSLKADCLVLAKARHCTADCLSELRLCVHHGCKGSEVRHT